MAVANTSRRYKTHYKTPTAHQKIIINYFNVVRRERRFPAVRITNWQVHIEIVRRSATARDAANVRLSGRSELLGRAFKVKRLTHFTDGRRQFAALHSRSTNVLGYGPPPGDVGYARYRVDPLRQWRRAISRSRRSRNISDSHGEWFDRWCRERDPAVKRRILDYNEDDCRATRVLLDRIRSLAA